MAAFNILPASALSGRARLVEDPEFPSVATLLEEPALKVMTDLTRVPAVSVLPDASVAEANSVMLQRRVRMAFVIDDHKYLLGIVTTNDILGEKPMQIVRSRGVTHSEVCVRDIMTAADKVEVLDMAELEQARVGDLVETLREHGRQHALVVRRDADDRPEVCGVFSAADLSRRLGVPVVPVEVARTFAEIEEMIGRA